MDLDSRYNELVSNLADWNIRDSDIPLQEVPPFNKTIIAQKHGSYLAIRCIVNGPEGVRVHLNFGRSGTLRYRIGPELADQKFRTLGVINEGAEGSHLTVMVHLPPGQEYLFLVDVQDQSSMQLRRCYMEDYVVTGWCNTEIRAYPVLPFPQPAGYRAVTEVTAATRLYMMVSIDDFVQEARVFGGRVTLPTDYDFNPNSWVKCNLHLSSAVIAKCVDPATRGTGITVKPFFRSNLD